MEHASKPPLWFDQIPTQQMDMLPRQDKITRDHIQQVLDEHSGSQDSFLVISRATESHYGGDEELEGLEERNNLLMAIYTELIKEARVPHSHVSRMDHLLFELMECNFCRSNLSQNIASDTHHLLRRLPVYSLDLPDRIPYMDRCYFHEPLEGTYWGEWLDLAVSNACSLNTLRIAIYINTRPTDIRGIQDYLTLLEQLVTLASQRDGKSPAGFILRAALWTSWQRVYMLYLFAIIGNEIHRGPGALVGAEIVSREFQLAERYGVHEMQNDYSVAFSPIWDRPDNMCSWAFEILKREPCCMGLDFRRFLERLRSAWGQQQSRCRNEQGYVSQCPGRYCQRLSGFKVKDQSAHDEGCDANCCRLFWDEKSYRAVQKIRAVSVTRTNSKTGIQYCSASKRSLAISHVWYHGQGGRPEDGINECLHKRYAEIAARCGCDSYWWDSACIPDSHQLRREAIQGINWVFANSKVVLVCDQDIMKIDISDCPIWKKEMILAIVLVSDWNVRAWTFLESMRGRNHLYLVCKNNACINFLDLVKDIWSDGSIDIAILSLAARHMLPWDTLTSSLTGDENVGLELAGFMLSSRPASRKGDDLVIWSLLIGLDKDSTAPLPFEDEEQDSEEFVARFWKTFVNRHIATGFLMSSAPRLTGVGLTWAPRTASCLVSDSYTPYSSYDGMRTSLACITDQGIVGEWMMYEFSVEKVLASVLDAYTSPLIRRLKELCEEYLRDCSKGALIHPVTEEAKNTSENLIQESAQCRAESVVLFESPPGLDYTGYQGKHGGTSLVILGLKAHDSREPGWIWKSTYQWSDSTDFPPFKLVRNVLIS